jgi:hypothetical protein
VTRPLRIAGGAKPRIFGVVRCCGVCVCAYYRYVCGVCVCACVGRVRVLLKMLSFDDCLSFPSWLI